jgi:hypothetical protein
VWVDDRLLITGEFAGSDPQVSAVFNAARDNAGKVSEKARELLASEDLEVQDYTAVLVGDNVELRILSKVRFKDSSKPANLNWVSSFGGRNPGLKNGENEPKDGKLSFIGTGGQPLLQAEFKNTNAPAEVRLSVYKQNGRYNLQVSRLARIDNFIRLIKTKYDLNFDSFFAGGERIEFQTTLKSGGITEKLLLWDTGDADHLPMHSARLEEIEANKKMTGNQQLRLVTSLKVCEPGFYPIKASPDNAVLQKNVTNLSAVVITNDIAQSNYVSRFDAEIIQVCRDFCSSKLLMSPNRDYKIERRDINDWYVVGEASGHNFMLWFDVDPLTKHVISHGGE